MTRKTYKIGIYFNPIYKKILNIQRINLNYKNKGYDIDYYLDNNISIIKAHDFEIKIEKNGTFSIFKYYNSIKAEYLMDLFNLSKLMLKDFLKENKINIKYKNEINFIFSGKKVKKIINSDEFIFNIVGYENFKLFNKEIYFYNEDFLLAVLKGFEFLI
ncbi:MAG: hypothetical protein ACFFDN_17170 [Candidatus Hodarchaeota archaeon]